MATKYNLGDKVILNTENIWSFERYDNTEAEIIEIDDSSCPYLVRAYDGKGMWIKETSIRRKKRGKTK